MGRPPLTVGTYGTITTAWAARENAWKARARYRDPDGVVRPVAKFGKTKSAAERALKDALRDRQRSGGLGITGDMRVCELADEWLARIAKSNKSIGTKQQYRRAVESNVKPALGEVRIAEVRVSVADAALQTILERNGYSVAKTARAVMSSMFGLAVRQDAIATNPLRDVEKLTRTETKKKPKALTIAQVNELRTLLPALIRAGDLDVVDLVDFMLMTGCRVGEALACRLDAFNADGMPLVDLEAGTWEINATVIRVLGVKRHHALEKESALTSDEAAELERIQALPPGLYVQEHPKSEAGWRVIALPPAAVSMLIRRRDEERLRPREVPLVNEQGKVRYEQSHVVFPSPAARSLRDPNNAEGDLREILDRIDCATCDKTGSQIDPDSGEFVLTAKGRRIRCAAGPWSWVTSHTFRKTVATRMEEAGCTPRQVADQLGHSKVSMTQDVYFGRDVVVAEAARILDR